MDCMTPDELALWQHQNARNRADEPCVDCPRWFARQAAASGCCQRERDRLNARNRRYRAVVRAQVQAVRLARARAKEYTGSDEYSVSIAHNAQRPASRLYSEVRGVDIPEYRRNG